jgi:hypothetical protein
LKNEISSRFSFVYAYKKGIAPKMDLFAPKRVTIAPKRPVIAPILK